jgi:hypothetical protein
MLWNAAGVMDLDMVRLNGFASISMMAILSNYFHKMIHRFMLNTRGITTKHNIMGGLA